MCENTITDLEIAKAYISKAKNAEDRGLEFSLSFTSFKNIKRAKKCKYSGLILTRKTSTIDRVDPTKGYISGNVVACHTAINQAKSIVELPKKAGLDDKTMLKFLKGWTEMLEKNIEEKTND